MAEKGATMSQQLNPYITFNGNCAKAMEFYGKALGAQPQTMTFRESGMDVDGVMHSSLDPPPASTSSPRGTDAPIWCQAVVSHSR